jgi:hypothetical protein
MASLYRPKIVEYRLPNGSYRTPDGKRVTKNTPGAVKSKRPSKKSYGRYTDGAGRPMRVPLSESKETSRRMLAKIASDVQLASVGITDPFAEHFSRPLLGHLEDYRRYLEAKGNTSQHVALSCSRIRTVKDVQPLRKDVAEMLRQYIAGKPPRAKLWPGTWKSVGAEMLLIDLATAGIPYQDDAGRYFDFHAMRGQFVSLLAASGVHPKGYPEGKAQTRHDGRIARMRKVPPKRDRTGFPAIPTSSALHAPCLSWRNLLAPQGT